MVNLFVVTCHPLRMLFCSIFRSILSNKVKASANRTRFEPVFLICIYRFNSMVAQIVGGLEDYILQFLRFLVVKEDIFNA